MTPTTGIKRQTLERLKDRLAALEWAPGSFIPTEEQLVDEMGVSRKTLRAALSELERQGVLVAQRGRGRIVAGEVRTAPGMLAKAVVLLTNLPDPNRDPNVLKSAADKVVEMAAVSAIEAAGLHSFVLNPQYLELSEVSKLVRERPSGVIAGHGVAESRQGQEILYRLKEQGIPVVAHGDGEGLDGLDRVAADHYRGSLQLTQWLIGRGARRILRVWADGPASYWRTNRDRAYVDAMRQAGLEPLEPLIIHGYQSRAQADSANFQARTRQMAGYCLEHLQGPRTVDAIMLPTDLDVFPAAAACRLLGKEPGKDVLVVGFDNLWRDCWERDLEGYVPPVTVERNDGRVGSTMVNLLTRRISGELTEASQRVLVETELVTVTTPR